MRSKRVTCLNTGILWCKEIIIFKLLLVAEFDLLINVNAIQEHGSGKCTFKTTLWYNVKDVGRLATEPEVSPQVCSRLSIGPKSLPWPCPPEQNLWSIQIRNFTLMIWKGWEISWTSSNWSKLYLFYFTKIRSAPKWFWDELSRTHHVPRGKFLPSVHFTCGPVHSTQYLATMNQVQKANGERNLSSQQLRLRNQEQFHLTCPFF